jgi:CTP synthase
MFAIFQKLDLELDGEQCEDFMVIFMPEGDRMKMGGTMRIGL